MHEKTTKKFEKHFVDIDQFRAAFKFIHCSFEFNVNNTELTQELVNLLNLDRHFFFETDMLLFPIHINSSKKDELVLLM